MQATFLLSISLRTYKYVEYTVSSESWYDHSFLLNEPLN